MRRRSKHLVAATLKLGIWKADRLTGVATLVDVAACDKRLRLIVCTFELDCQSELDSAEKQSV